MSQCQPNYSGSAVTHTVTAGNLKANDSQLNSDLPSNCTATRTVTAKEANKFGLDSDSEQDVLEVATMLTMNIDVDTDRDIDSDWDTEVDQLDPESYL
jgi:hypothetical protein